MDQEMIQSRKPASGRTSRKVNDHRNYSNNIYDDNDGDDENDDDGDDDDDTWGRVTYRSREGTRSYDYVTTPPRSTTRPSRRHEDGSIPIRTSPNLDSPNSNLASRNTTASTTTRKDKENSSHPSRQSGVENHHWPIPDISVTTDDENDSHAKDNNSFKSWLISGFRDMLGTAAGVTLSSTGRIVAPSLHITRTVLLPGLFALLVEKLDDITPPRVQDWFRIVTSTFHHLILVLGDTPKGKVFSQQGYVVCQDIIQIFCSSEARQVLVDGMAASVKMVEALNTPETKACMEQMSILLIRLLDVISSGHVKQGIQNCQVMSEKAIEMAADPATTLALAEVTAHLCHALEETTHAPSVAPKDRRRAGRKRRRNADVNTTTRIQRNARNQKIYMNLHQTKNFPDQVTMEEIILSCLGKLEDETLDTDNVRTEQQRTTQGEGNREDQEGTVETVDDLASLHSRMSLDDITFESDSRHYKDWKDRKDQVDVELLKRKITTSSGETATSIEHDEDNVGDASSSTDIEDIEPSSFNGGRSLLVKESESKNIGIGDEMDIPSVDKFYSRLDEMIQKNKVRLQGQNLKYYQTGEAKRRQSRWTTKEQTFSEQQLNDMNDHEKKSRKTKGNGILQRRRLLFFIAVASFVSAFICVCGLACFGTYVLISDLFARRTPMTIDPFSPAKKGEQQEVVIRIVREIVHVTEEGKIIGKSASASFTQDELESISASVAATLQQQ